MVPLYSRKLTRLTTVRTCVARIHTSSSVASRVSSAIHQLNGDRLRTGTVGFPATRLLSTGWKYGSSAHQLSLRSFSSTSGPPRGGGGGGGMLPPWMHPESNKSGHYLEQYTTDLTKLAAEGKLDPVIGRHEEIRRCLQILARRTKSNPVLIGEAGVGKSAIAEGLAQRIQSGEVPESMKDKRVLSLDLAALTAGTRSDFVPCWKSELSCVRLF
jgi:hypothetical protein